MRTEIMNTIRLLEKVMTVVSDFEGKKVNDTTRREIHEFLQNAKSGSMGVKFFQRNGGKRIFLWYRDPHKGLAPDITIDGSTGVIHVCIDCLIGTLQGLYERYEESR